MGRGFGLRVGGIYRPASTTLNPYGAAYPQSGGAVLFLAHDQDLTTNWQAMSGDGSAVGRGNPAIPTNTSQFYAWADDADTIHQITLEFIIE